MKTNFRCCKCKVYFTDTEPFKNAAGLFCESCKKELYTKAINGMRLSQVNKRGICPFCGDVADEPKVREDSGTFDNVCSPCKSMRARVLKCIRYSDRMAKHVAKVEEREAEMREQRQRVTPIATTDTGRVANLERMMLRLMDELGMKVDEA